MTNKETERLSEELSKEDGIVQNVPNQPPITSATDAFNICKRCNKQLLKSQIANVFELENAFMKQKLLNEAYHPSCVQCWSCGKSTVKELRYVDGKLNCWKCSIRYESVICTLCKLLLADVEYPKQQQDKKKVGTTTVISTAFGMVHRNCFQCVVCRKLLTKTYYLNEGQLFCQQDYLKRLAPICKRCFLQILPDKHSDTGKYVVAEGHKYHLACWQCHQCHISLNKKEFCRLARQILCIECGNKARNELSNKSKNSESSNKSSKTSGKLKNDNNKQDSNMIGEDLGNFFRIQT